MRHYKITTPVAEFTGAVGGVHFANGTAGLAVPDDRQDPAARALAYFQAQGYQVEEVTELPAAGEASIDPAARVAELEAALAVAKKEKAAADKATKDAKTAAELAAKTPEGGAQ